MSSQSTVRIVSHVSDRTMCVLVRTETSRIKFRIPAPSRTVNATLSPVDGRSIDSEAIAYGSFRSSEQLVQDVIQAQCG